MRLNRAAGDLNPFLMVLAIGLLILDLTLYIGMMASQQAYQWVPQHEGGSFSPSSATPPGSFREGSPAAPAGN